MFLLIACVAIRGLAASGGPSFAADGSAADRGALPARFRAFLMVLDQNAAEGHPQPLHGMPPSPGETRATKESSMVSITIDRFCTAEEGGHLEESVASGGTRALLAALRESHVGSIQINDGVRRSIRWASRWTAEGVERISLAVLDPLIPQNLEDGRIPMKGQPIVILEFTLPPDDAGEGTLVTVTDAEIDRHGNIEAASLPPDGVQRLTRVTRVAGGKDGPK